MQLDQALQGGRHQLQLFITRLGTQSQVRSLHYHLERRSCEAPRSLVFPANWRTAGSRLISDSVIGCR